MDATGHEPEVVPGLGHVELPQQRAALGLRQRLARGAGAHLAAHVIRVLVQFVMAGVLLPAWGLQLYGDWLILVGIAVFLGGSDFGFISASVSDMILAVGRGDRDHALDVFRTVTRGLAIVFSAAFALAVVAVLLVPIVKVLGLERIDEGTAAAILLMIVVQVILTVWGLLMYGGFACEGHYGEGVLIQAAMVLAEYAAACVAAILGSGPLLATAVLLAARVVGTIGMYVRMRQRTPWLSVGRPAGRARVGKRLTRPALSLASIGWGGALNVQAMIIIVGVTTGPASSAIFATIRTLSRVVLQLTGSISQAVGPELGKAYAEGDQSLVQRLQRRVNQASIWSALLFIAIIVLFGGEFVRIWTRGHVREAGLLLDLLLIGAGAEAAWLTAGSILFFTNRHSRVGLAYAILSIAGLPLAYVFTTLWGRQGAAASLIVVAILMLVYVLRHALPATHETVFSWLRSLVRPTEVWRAFGAMRAQLRLLRSS